ncbi:MAG: rod shape-determining protein MreC [Verrucomicrobia bacterium]|nr:rod shape-determining protein MreC [Verrucomicrobiota bacterium]MCH8510895.1 rod shape-determining protein MreC [Kiritimatiellia bacterium]
MKRKGWIFWLSIGAILLIALNLPAPASRALKSMTREFIAPLQSLGASVSSRFRNAREAIMARGGLPEEHQTLRRELVDLQHQLLELEELRRENLLLRRQLNFVDRSPRELIPAEVLARDISGWWQTIRVDHGGNPAVRANQAVTTAEGLAGKTLEISGRTAEVLLISDPACRVAVEIGDKGAFGILSGQGLSWRGSVLCRVELINKNIPIERSDPVYTSGLGGIFPKGFLVGYIEDVTLDENGLHQSATVRPRANLSDLRVVFIVTETDDREDLR